MEITNEIKAKVFLPYWGKTFINGMGGKSALSFVDIQDVADGKIEAKLLLKPLTAISDEDELLEAVINLQKRLDFLINATPSAIERNVMTEENIIVCTLINDCLNPNMIREMLTRRTVR